MYIDCLSYIHLEFSLTAARRRVRDRKVPRTYRLSPAKVAAAQRILGTPTATETIEAALDLVVFRDELVAGTRAMLGVEIDSLDPPTA
jgi:hypothetical protein